MERLCLLEEYVEFLNLFEIGSRVKIHLQDKDIVDETFENISIRSKHKYFELVHLHFHQDRMEPCRSLRQDKKLHFLIEQDHPVVNSTSGGAPQNLLIDENVPMKHLIGIDRSQNIPIKTDDPVQRLMVIDGKRDFPIEDEVVGQFTDIDKKEICLIEEGNRVVNSNDGGGPRNLSIEKKGPVGQYTADNGKKNSVENDGASAQSIVVDEKRSLGFDRGDSAAQSILVDEEQSLGFDRGDSAAQSIVVDEEQSLAFDQDDSAASSETDTLDEKINRLSKRRAQTLKKVDEKEEMVKKLHKEDPKYREKRKKIKADIARLIIEESSYDNEIRLLKQEKEKQ